jgi:8-oxo-dGTP diphosphatase
MGDGNGWVVCALGHRHWGRHGAAGLLIRSGGQVILQHRAPWTHEGDSWGLPGGARDSHEDVVQAALREAGEEAGIQPETVAPYGLLVDDHGGWSYTTVLARPHGAITPYAANAESCDVRWRDVAGLGDLALHHGFAATWSVLGTSNEPLTVVVDAANVVDARPDGWWRDRAAATRRLLDGLRTAAAAGIAPGELPAGIDQGSLSRVLPRLTVVVEGAAVEVANDGPNGGHWAARQVVVHAAPGDGDTEVVRHAAAAQRAGEQTVVVTADRRLRARVAAGTVVVGPSWLLGLAATS